MNNETIQNLIACVEASINMVDGDGKPPDWDFLRMTLSAAHKEFNQIEGVKYD